MAKLPFGYFTIENACYLLNFDMYLKLPSMKSANQHSSQTNIKQKLAGMTRDE